MCDIHSQSQGTDEDYFIKPLPVSSRHKLPWSNVACHKKERRCALQNTKSSAVMPRCQRYCQPLVGGHHFHARFIDKAYQYFIAGAVMLGWYNVNWDLFSEQEAPVWHEAFQDLNNLHQQRQTKHITEDKVIREQPLSGLQWNHCLFIFLHVRIRITQESSRTAEWTVCVQP